MLIHVIVFILILISNNNLSINATIMTLRDSSQLTSSCYSFPVVDYGKDNNVRYSYGSSPHLLVNVDDIAIDFELPNQHGTLYRLQELLKMRPVALIWGHYTCPAFQGLNSDTMFIGSSYEEEYSLVDTFGDSIYFLHLIGPEPHPMWPDSNFDSGNIRMNLWSSIRQPKTFSDRMANSVSPVLPYLHDKSILLIDYLDGPSGERNNPVWCSYANGARSAILIGMDGLIKYTQTWFKRESLEEAILKL